MGIESYSKPIQAAEMKFFNLVAGQLKSSKTNDDIRKDFNTLSTNKKLTEHRTKDKDYFNKKPNDNITKNYSSIS